MPRINIDFTRSLLPLKQSSFVVPRLPHQLIAFKQFATVCIVLGTNEIRDFNFRIIHVSLLSAYCIIWHFRSLDCQRFFINPHMRRSINRKTFSAASSAATSYLYAMVCPGFRLIRDDPQSFRCNIRCLPILSSIIILRYGFGTAKLNRAIVVENEQKQILKQLDKTRRGAVMDSFSFFGHDLDL